jgi:hypothetical protein
MRSPFLAVFTGLALVTMGAACGANDWPIPQNAEAARKARRYQVAWTERTLAAPYERVGKKDPRWDGLVRHLRRSESFLAGQPACVRSLE